MNSELPLQKIDKGFDPLSQRKEKNDEEKKKNADQKRLQYGSRKIDFGFPNGPGSSKQIEKNEKFEGSLPDISSFGYSKDELHLSERIMMSEEMEFLFGDQVYKGTFLMTNYRLDFKVNDSSFYDLLKFRKNFFNTPLMLIHKVERIFEKNLILLEIVLKDTRLFRFKFPNFDKVDKIVGKLSDYSTIITVSKSPSFILFEEFEEIEIKYKGWKIYNAKNEFIRQGVDFSLTGDMQILENGKGEICKTYPPILVIPRSINSEIFDKCSKFRSKNRLPVLTYLYKNSNRNVKLYRSAQCISGFTSRSSEDELYFRILGDLTMKSPPDVINLHVYDARPFLNALGNKLNGKGYETKKNYKNCEIEFLNIHNIQRVKDSYKKMMKASLSPDPTLKYYSTADTSGWLDHIASILDGSIKIVKSILSGTNVLIHCSDGWDRTSQLSALVQIMIDPYYRTLEGIMILIQKDFVSFGHPFNLRYGHSNGDDQLSFIFLQFLDCLHQLVSQFPISFEFNKMFLLELAHNLYNCNFGTFLCDCYQELLFYNVEEKSASIWSYILSKRDKYINSFYDHQKSEFLTSLEPCTSIKDLRIWKEYFLYYYPGSKDPYCIYDIEFSDEIKGIVHGFYKSQNKMLKERIEELSIENNRMKIQLENPKENEKNEMDKNS